MTYSLTLSKCCSKFSLEQRSQKNDTQIYTNIHKNKINNTKLT